jgi:putative ABC transport system permease protein
MKLLAKSFFYLNSFFLKRKLDTQLTEEIRTHVDMATEANVAAGMPPEEARYAALREFGNVARVQEKTRDEHGWVWLEQWGKDAAFAFRSLAKARSFSLTVLGTLMIGIGVATVVFDLTASTVIFAQPYPQPEQLYIIGFKDKQNPINSYLPAAVFSAYQQQVNVFSEYAAVTQDTVNVAVEGEPVIANLVNASVDCFHTLGIKPMLGRGFLPEEFRTGADNVVIISGLFWRQHFNASSDVLGRKILVDRQVCIVVGVLDISKPLPGGGDVYRPLVLKFDPISPLSPTVSAIGRLRPGVSVAQANAALAAVKSPELPNWAVAFLSEQQPALFTLTEINRPETYWVMLIGAGLLYAVACVNAVNLMLVRLIGRRRELCIRFALGGTRWQVVRLLLIESMGLALAASLVVALAARWLFPPLFVLTQENEAMRFNSYWDWQTLSCIAGLSLFASVVVVLVPAWRLFNTNLNTTLKDGGAALGGSRRMNRLRNGLVVLQTALAVILLAGTGLMVRSFDKLHHIDLGFNPVGKMKVRIAFPYGYDLEPEARLQLFERLQQRLATIPGVRGVSVGQDTLLEGGFWGIAQVLMPDGTYKPAAASIVGADFQKTAGLVLKKGRWFSGRRGEMEVVINETFSKTRFGAEDPIGKSFKLLVSGDNNYLIVGVVGDVKETVRSTPGMREYAPDWAYPLNIDTLLLRLDQDPGKEFAGVVRHAIYEFDPRLIASRISSINQDLSDSMWTERYAFMILKGLSAIALGLAVVGLFSVIAFTVDSRQQEYGVRLALGATPENLHRLVMKRGVTTAAVGIIFGIAGALGLTRFMQSLLFETTPNDPLVYAAVAVVMLGAAALACWLPARRAAKADPIVALRAE